MGPFWTRNSTRLRGRGKHRIAYRHIIDWLVRKPGALADYCYRDDLFPSSRFRLVYDRLVEQQPERAAKEYLSILYLAARESEAVVEAALEQMLRTGGPQRARSVIGHTSEGHDRPPSTGTADSMAA